MNTLPLQIVSTGISIPKHQFSSSELDKLKGFPHGTIEKNSGIKSRFFFDDHDTLAEISAKSIKNAVMRGNIEENTIDLVISASAVPEQALPCSAAKIIDYLNLKEGTPGFDINNSCLSFMTALYISASLLNSNAYKTIAIVSTEFASRGINWIDLESSAIFGDGSASVIVQKGKGESQCLSYLLENYPEGKDLCQIRAGGSLKNIVTGMEKSDHYFKMDGKKVFKLASEKITSFLQKLFLPLKMSIHDIHLIIPHQASHLSLKHMIKRLGFDEKKVINIYETHGNQVSASIPTALYYADEAGLLKKGQKLLLLGTGAGLCCGGMILSL